MLSVHSTFSGRCWKTSITGISGVPSFVGRTAQFLFILRVSKSSRAFSTCGPFSVTTTIPPGARVFPPSWNDTSKTGEIGPLVAAFPVEQGDQIMMVSDGGQVIRVPVGGIRMAGRATKGVTIFSTAKDERVVSVDRISEPEAEEELDEVADTVTEAGSEAPDTAPNEDPQA